MVQGVVVENGCIVDVNPANQEVVDRVPVSTPEDINAAIARAKAAQVGWAATPLEERITKLKAAVKNLQKDKDGLALTIVKEMGKVLSEAKEEVDGAADKDDFLDLVYEANKPVRAPTKEGEATAVTVRQPHGVVAVCSPWNFPSDEILLLALPALAAGNTVVVKPSEVAPLTGKAVVDALKAGLPSGCAELLQGDGAVGAPLVEHPDVNMVAMTGSSATGRKIMQNCSSNLKRLVLELGGKDPMVVFADADLDKAAEDAVTFSFFNCGQVCCAVERVYVEKSVKADFEKKVTEQAKAWVAGDGQDEASKIGPMVSKMQREIVETHVADAVKNGAKMLFQGDAPKDSKGNYFPGTVLTDVQQAMTIQKEETFGPVVAIAEFDGAEKTAVELSNDSSYGLSASVYSKDLMKANRVAAGIKAGQVGINNYPLFNAHGTLPWVGHKGSGFGYHSGFDGWRQFSVPKSIIMTDPVPAGGGYPNA